jgi:hypothetical protein
MILKIRLMKIGYGVAVESDKKDDCRRPLIKELTSLIQLSKGKFILMIQTINRD